MSIDPDLFRQAMRSWATGVTVVSATHNNIQHGMTVSSFTSLSVSPPRVLVAISKQARTHPLIVDSGAFGVTVLSDQQTEISDRFAGRISDEFERFTGLETFQLKTGAPFLRGGLACIDCLVSQTVDAGTHTIFIGEVVAAESFSKENPLVYFNRQYRKVQN